MKRTYLIYMCSLMVSVPALAQTIRKGEVSIQDLNVSRNGKAVTVSMDIDISKLDISGDETVILTPVVEKGECEIELPAVEVMGRRSYLHFLRNDKKTVTPAPFYAERVAKRAERKKGEKQRIAYTAQIQFEEWMRGSTIGIYEGNCACSPAPVQVGEDQLGRFLPELYTPSYRLSFMEPEPEPVKVRDKALTAYINFYVDKYDIIRNYKDNARELDSVIHSIKVVEQDKDLTVTSVSIEGWASPEATEAHNKELSQNRANALADYVAKQTGIQRSHIQAAGRGEDWEGLKREVKATPNLQSRDEILAIIDDNTLTQDQKDQKLVELVPATIYQRLLNELYPRLRRNDYKIVYNVRNFNLEEARKLIDTDPTKLSVNEMYKVAGAYQKGSKDYNHVMEVAAKTYPENVAAAVNYAAIQLNAGDYDGTLATLYKSDRNDCRVQAVMGSVYLAKGYTEEARKIWEKAAAQGSADAKHNLAELNKYLNSL